jgi:hypothetical protein
MFLLVFTNSFIQTVCHVLPRDCQHENRVNNIKKCAQALVYIFLYKLYTFWFKTLHSTVLILEANFMALKFFFDVTSETLT